jgi:hypothetical protein
MRNRYDQLGKQIGEEALGPSGPTVVQHEIAPEVQYADLHHEPDPVRTAERERLGLLGRIASGPCLIELYSHAPSDAEFRACLGKHIAFWQQRARKASAAGKPAPEKPAPFLWVVAAGMPGAPMPLVTRLELAPVSGWPPGVYLFGDEVLRVGLVAASELPREPSTLLVRLMAGGPLLPHVLAELSVLPPDAHERIVAGPVLLRLHHALAKKPNRTPEEEEIIVATEDFFEFAQKQGWEQGQKQGWEQGQKQGWEQGQKQGWEQGQEQGRAEARANDVLTVLRVRGIPVPDAERERILSEKDLGRLERWLERAIVETSLAAVLHEPS